MNRERQLPEGVTAPHCRVHLGATMRVDQIQATKQRGKRVLVPEGADLFAAQYEEVPARVTFRCVVPGCWQVDWRPLPPRNGRQRLCIECNEPFTPQLTAGGTKRCLGCRGLYTIRMRRAERRGAEAA